MIDLWNDLAADAGLMLSAEQIRQLGLYLDLLIETNQTMNLTRISDKADAEIRHVADALTLLPLLPPVREIHFPLDEGIRGREAASARSSPPPAGGGGEEARVDVLRKGSTLAPLPLTPPARAGGKERPVRQLTLADVGTGGGIPGVILAIVRPDIAVTLIDATAKKLNAVHRMCDSIGLTNIRSIHGRMESQKLQFDIITARGVADLAKLLGWCRPLMKPSGVLLAMKGPKVVEEIASFSPQLRRRFRLVHHPVKPPQLAGHVNIEVRLGREKI